MFGSRSSPKLFDNVSKAICWILKKNYNIEKVLHLVDDFLTIDRPTFLADRTMAILTMVFNKLGLPLSVKETAGPSKVLEYLGVILDSEQMEARLPLDKLRRITDAVTHFRVGRHALNNGLLSLLGHLNFACRVIYPGCAFLSYLIRLSCTV